ncbi:hypothetical protein [Methanosphaera sp.]|uniref:phage distal tail protein n=1 Tax=Methanosphaera sp. TaxID=2666342 RepID=UPI0025E4F875|nr:hypothetical protein [Methanosphaera sp.]
MTTIKLYPTVVSLATNTNTDPYNGGHHKGWDYLDNLKVANGTAYCRHESYVSPYPLASNSHPDYQQYMIATSSGSNHTPAPLEFGFNFSSLPSNEEVARIVVHYKQQTFLNNGKTISINGATCSLINAGNGEVQTGSKVTTTLTEQIHTFYDVTRSSLQNSSFKIKLAYPKNTAETPGQLIIQNFYIEVITAKTMTKYPQKIQITPGYTCGGTDNQYKCWDYLDNLKTSNGIAYCRHESYATPDNPDRHYIAGKNGTYKQPAPLDLTNFGFNFGSDIVIEKIEIGYKQQKFINNGYYPMIGAPKLTILNTSKSAINGQREVTSSLQESKTTVSGISTTQINSSNFGVRLAYPANTATTPGRIILQNFYVKVYYNDTGTHLTIDGKFTPSSRTVGNPTSATFTVKKTSTAAYTSQTIIDLPLGIEVNHALMPEGNLVTENKTRNGYKYQRCIWTHNLPSGQNVSNQLILDFDTTYPTKDLSVTDATKCTITDKSTKTSYTCYFTVYDVQVTLSTTLYEDKQALKAEHPSDYTVTVKTNDPKKQMKVLHIRFGEDEEVLYNLDDIRALSFVDSAGFTTGAYWIKLVDNGSLNATIPLGIFFVHSGEYSVHMWVSYTDSKHVGNEISKSIVVLSTNLGVLCYSRLEIKDYWTEAMCNGIYYTLGTLVKTTLNNQDYTISDYGNNYRVGIFNSSSEYVNSDDFLEHVIWCNNMATSTAKEVLVKFKYNSSNPLYIVYSHGYTGDPVSMRVTFNFSEHLLVETSLWGTVNGIGHALWPTQALLTDGNNYARASMVPSIPELIPATVWDWDDGGLLNTNISILGMEVQFDYITTDTVVVECELYIDKNKRGKRQVTLTSGEGVASVGSVYDLFGFTPGELIDRTNERIYPFEIRIKVLNMYSNRAYININNVKAVIDYITRTKCGYGLSIDGERGEDYGILITKVVHHRGTENETSLYHVEGTDTTVVNRVNINTKEVELSIRLPNCSIKDGRYQVDKVVELFTNTRELHSNKPIPKQLIFDHLDDRYYEIVRVKEFDDKYVGNSYYADITLLVPSGTTYDVSDTISGPDGYSPSSIAVSPKIVYMAQRAGTAIIMEEELEQVLIITTPRILKDSKLTIDNANRKVYLGDTTDITEYVDFNSTWFKLRGNYSFSSDTGKILEVSYKVRRG